MLYFVFLMSRDCCVAIPHDVMGHQSAVVIVIFPDHTHLPFLAYLSRSDKVSFSDRSLSVVRPSVVVVH